MTGKICDDPEAALDGLLFDGMTIMSGGFGLTGNPIWPFRNHGAKSDARKAYTFQ